MLAQGFIQDLISRVDIVEVVGRQVELKRAGINHKGLCPFHGEKTPSFIVSASRQSYHCFGCGAHGDAIRFLTEYSGLSFMDAVRELAQQVGLRVPEDNARPEDRQRAAELRAHQTTLSEILARAGEHWRQQLKSSPRAVEYLKARGLSGEIAARFGLGYAPEGWRSLASVFAHYDDPLLVEAGLVIVQGEGEADAKRYDRFRDRVMCPIRSVRGDVIGFGGRVIDSGEPKYLNSPETPVFVKGRELYGLYEAKQALREKGYALVVEGYMDVVALAQLGFANAVATLGTACTADHVAKLFRFTDQVVFCFDGDAAGRRAAVRALQAALPLASDLRSIKFVFLPPEHDPDSFVREFGAQAFEQQISQALPLSRMLLQTAQDGADLTTPEGRARMLAQARALIEQLPAGLLREQILVEIAHAGAVSADQLRTQWGGRPDASNTRPSRLRMSGALTHRRTPRNTATLLDRVVWLLLQRSGLWEDIGDDDRQRMASQPAPYSTFFSLLERGLHEHGVLSRAALLHWLQDNGAQDGDLAALIERSEALHDLSDEVDALAELQAAALRLQEQQVIDELNLLAESGDMSSSQRERYEELHRVRVGLAARSMARPESPA